MHYGLCTRHYALWTMDYGLIASPTNAERCRGTAGAVAMGYRRQRGALARLSLAASRVFDLKMLGGGSMSESTTIGENFEERKSEAARWLRGKIASAARWLRGEIASAARWLRGKIANAARRWRVSLSSLPAFLI